MPCAIKAIDLKKSSDYDCLVVIEDDAMPKAIATYVTEAKKFDKAFSSDVSCFKCDNTAVVFSPVDVDDYSDVREYFRSAKKGIERAFKAGFVKPALVLPSTPKFKNAEVSTLLGALAGLYVPIQFREDVPTKANRIEQLLVASTQASVAPVIELATALESGLFISRDIGGGDPERMAPPNVATYVEKAFSGGKIKVEVISNQDKLEKEFPLFGAVNRATRGVPRHQGRIVFLEYVPPKPSRKTLMLVGKGVTYDTGGADIKAGGKKSNSA